MTNTTEELRKRLEEKMLIHNEDMWHVVFTNRNGDKLIVDDLFVFLQSEIEAAERKGFKSGYIEGLHYAGDNICEEDLDKITDSFLKNPER